MVSMGPKVPLKPSAFSLMGFVCLRVPILLPKIPISNLIIANGNDYNSS